MVFLILETVKKQNKNFNTSSEFSTVFFFFLKIEFLYIKKWGKKGSFIRHQHNICKTVLTWKAPAVTNSFLYGDPTSFSQQVFKEHLLS